MDDSTTSIKRRYVNESGLVSGTTAVITSVVSGKTRSTESSCAKQIAPTVLLKKEKKSGLKSMDAKTTLSLIPGNLRMKEGLPHQNVFPSPGYQTATRLCDCLKVMKLPDFRTGSPER